MQFGRNWCAVAEVHHHVVEVAVDLVVVVVVVAPVVPVVARLVAAGRFRTIADPTEHRLYLGLEYSVLRIKVAVFELVASSVVVYKEPPIPGKHNAREAPVVAVPGDRDTVAVPASTGPFAAAHGAFQTLGMRSSREVLTGIAVPAGPGTSVTTALRTLVRDP